MLHGDEGVRAELERDLRRRFGADYDVFAHPSAGDVRHGSVRRVASAVGGGSIAVRLVHLRLAELAG